MHLVPHLERFGDGREGRSDLAWRDLEVFEGELRAHQEVTELAVGVMVGIQDVATGIMDEPGDARHDALAVLAMNQQHDRLGVVRHPGHRRAGLTDLGMVLSSGCQRERKTRVRLLSPRKGVNRKDLKRCVVSQAATRAPPRSAPRERSVGYRIAGCGMAMRGGQGCMALPKQIVRGLFHWTAIHPEIHIRVHSYYLAQERLLIDPLLASPSGLECLDRHRPSLSVRPLAARGRSLSSPSCEARTSGCLPAARGGRTRASADCPRQPVAPRRTGCPPCLGEGDAREEAARLIRCGWIH